ncbi:hypothetical protein [Burkholderia gladioli]|uniref:hypothetical protein n=1 Tax=Burkholderia gladioli TaxID=28095 RepID=UPI000F52443B|nr:hypothetical protein [Burkholderia gladioli]
MSPVLSPFARALEARVQYAYAVCTTDIGSPAWFTHLAAARQHAIALGRAHAAQDSYECPNLIADIPMLRAAFESAVLDMRRSRLGQVGAEAPEKTPLCSRNLGGRQEQRAPGPAQAQA